MRTLDVCLAVLICGDNGYSRDLLDVCFGDQLAGFVTLGTYALGLAHILDSPVVALGHSLKYFYVGWMNLRLCDAYRIIMPTDT